MLLNKKEVVEIKKENLRIFNMVDKFLKENRGSYFDAEEISHAISSSVPKIESQLIALFMRTPVYSYEEEKYIAIDRIEIDGVFFYGIV